MGRRKTAGGLAIAGFAVWLLAGSNKHQEVPALPAPQPAEPEAAPLPAVVEAVVVPRVRKSWRRRTATTLVFTSLFFAGAALTAGAGNELAHVDAGSTDPAAATDVTTTD